MSDNVVKAYGKAGVGTLGHQDVLTLWEQRVHGIRAILTAAGMDKFKES